MSYKSTANRRRIPTDFNGAGLLLVGTYSGETVIDNSQCGSYEVSLKSDHYEGRAKSPSLLAGTVGRLRSTYQDNSGKWLTIEVIDPNTKNKIHVVRPSICDLRNSEPVIKVIDRRNLL